jgi:hypothetical protein
MQHEEEGPAFFVHSIKEGGAECDWNLRLDTAQFLNIAAMIFHCKTRCKRSVPGAPEVTYGLPSPPIRMPAQPNAEFASRGNIAQPFQVHGKWRNNIPEKRIHKIQMVALRRSPSIYRPGCDP